MKKYLQDLKEEFTCGAIDLQVALLALECLDFCETAGIWDCTYTDPVLKECRHTMTCFVEQHAEELAYTAARIVECCTGQSWKVFYPKEENKK